MEYVPFFIVPLPPKLTAHRFVASDDEYLGKEFRVVVPLNRHYLLGKDAGMFGRFSEVQATQASSVFKVSRLDEERLGIKKIKMDVYDGGRYCSSYLTSPKGGRVCVIPINGVIIPRSNGLVQGPPTFGLKSVIFRNQLAASVLYSECTNRLEYVSVLARPCKEK